MLENSTMCKEIYWKIPIFMLESVGKFHCGHWNVLEMSTVLQKHTYWKIPSALLFGPAHPPYMLEFCISLCNSVVSPVKINVNKDI